MCQRLVETPSDCREARPHWLLVTVPANGMPVSCWCVAAPGRSELVTLDIDVQVQATAMFVRQCVLTNPCEVIHNRKSMTLPGLRSMIRQAAARHAGVALNARRRIVCADRTSC